MEEFSNPSLLLAINGVLLTLVAFFMRGLILKVNLTLEKHSDLLASVDKNIAIILHDQDIAKKDLESINRDLESITRDLGKLKDRLNKVEIRCTFHNEQRSDV